MGEFAGRYQLYCTKGVLNTSFSCTELIPVTGCSPLPLNEWRKAPKITLRSAANDATLHEYCSCSVPETSESIVISSASEDENEGPEVWVNNGAYTLNCRDKEVVLSRRGWLTDKIICAAQTILLQFFPNMTGLQPPHCREFCISCPLWGICPDHTCQKQPLVCCVHSWLSEWCCPRV